MPLLPTYLEYILRIGSYVHLYLIAFFRSKIFDLIVNGVVRRDLAITKRYFNRFFNSYVRCKYIHGNIPFKIIARLKFVIKMLLLQRLISVYHVL